MEYQQARQMLTAVDHIHLLQAWPALTPAEQQSLLTQIQHLDFDALRRQQQLLNEPPPIPLQLAPFDAYALVGHASDRLEGQRLLSQGRMGCLIVAGGQGSRLRFDGPKGMCEVTPIKHKSLFQLFAEKTLAASKQAGAKLPLAIMTSPQNHAATVAFFAQHHHFGLDSEQISFFSQEMLPLLDINGRLFLEDAHTLATGPDGNGGALHHFYHSGVWQKWQAQGIRYLNFVVVDNALADPFDSELLGYHVRTHSDITVKCALRRDAHEKVGLLAKSESGVVVVEYSEIPEQDRLAANSDGSLQYRCANLSLFCFSMDFIEDVAKAGTSPMPLHKAFKAVKYLAPDGKTVQAEIPMAWKFEKFIFDLLPKAKKVSALLYARENCFAPLKNFTGPDSLGTVHEALQRRDRQVLSELTGQKCEASPIELDQQFYYPTADLINQWQGKKVTVGGYIST